jgi:hypothetical protein
MSVSALTAHNCFTHWWATLPAVPATRDGSDWWAPNEDGRCPAYKRLKRVWFDTTRFLSPKADPCRPHEFSKPSHGTHLTCKTWESFVLFDPADWIPRFLAAADIGCPITPIDCAWSYEFEAMVGDSSKFKLADIVFHARARDREELLVVVEVKRPGDKLKENSDLPDTEPGSYLDREAFRDVANRRLVYLVDAAYAPVVRQKVTRSDRRWGVITWAQLAELQIALSTASFPEPLRGFINLIIESQFSGLQITGKNTIPSSCGLPHARDLSDWRRTLAAAGAMPTYLSNFVAGALQYLECLHGARPSALAFDYLEAEPSFEDIHNLPSNQRQRTSDRREALWRLPPLR